MQALIIGTAKQQHAEDYILRTQKRLTSKNMGILRHYAKLTDSYVAGDTSIRISQNLKPTQEEVSMQTTHQQLTRSSYLQRTHATFLTVLDNEVQEIIREVALTESSSVVAEYQQHKTSQKASGCIARSSKYALPLPPVDANPSRLAPHILSSSEYCSLSLPNSSDLPHNLFPHNPIVPRLDPQRSSQGHFPTFPVSQSGSRHSQTSNPRASYTILSPYHGEQSTLEAPPSHCTGLVSGGYPARV